MALPARLLRPIVSGDPDARRYIEAVQRADGNTLEPGVRKAITDFVVGCKVDGIWSAIKASCILMGARTLSGALVPLVGTAPTNNNFVSGDYNRKTGLVGNGSTKSLDSNYPENTDALNDHHFSAYVTTLASRAIIAALTNSTASEAATRSRSSSADFYTASVGFIGVARGSSVSYVRRNGGVNTTVTRSSSVSISNNYIILDNANSFHGNHRVAFYSLGPYLTLSSLDTRVSDLYTAIGNAIP